MKRSAAGEPFSRCGRSERRFATAYLRFAAVYRVFHSTADFEAGAPVNCPFQRLADARKACQLQNPTPANVV